MPDVLERDCGVTLDQVKRIERAIDELRAQLFTMLTATPADDASAAGEAV
jgi:hypothetical protein